MRKLPDFFTNSERNEKYSQLNCLYLYYEIKKGDDVEFFDYLRERVKDSYINAEYLTKVLREEGFTGVAQLLEDKFPSANSHFGVRPGDFGEVVTEILLEDVFGFVVPVKKLRYKTNRDVASFGVDVIAFKLAEDRKKDTVVFSETKTSKNKDYGIDDVIQEIDELAGFTDKGKQKIRSTIRFISERLFSEGLHELETRISKFLEKPPNQTGEESYIPCLIRDMATWNHNALYNKSFVKAPIERTIICVCALENLEKTIDEAYRIQETTDHIDLTGYSE